MRSNKHVGSRNIMEKTDNKAIDFEQEFENILYSISHDFGAVLRHIRIFHDLVWRQHRDTVEGSQQEHLHIVDNSIQKMETMLTAILKLSRLLTDHDGVRTVPLSAMMNNVLRTLKPIIVEKNISLVTSEYFDVTVMPKIFENMLLEVIKNAVTFTRSDVAPILKIHCEQKDDFYSILIQNNGIPLTARNPENLFKLFSVLDRSNAQSGIGAGLAIAQKIIQMHEGDIQIFQDGDFFSVKITMKQ